MILYFSGTGNSAFIANKLQFALQDSMISINDRLREKSLKPIHSERPLIFVTPTYAWGLPKVVEQWIRRVKFTGCQSIYFIMTCGDSIGNAGKYLKKLCQDKNFRYMGVKAVIMPENYIAMFSAPEEPEAIATVMRAEPVIEEIVETIQNNQSFNEAKITFKDSICSGPVKELFYRILVRDKQFLVKEECIRCGKCVSVCPLNNIKMLDNVPVWNHNCTHCMRCINECPVEAIEYGSSTFGKRRYLCPEETWK